MQQPRPVEAAAMAPIPRWGLTNALTRAYTRRRVTRNLEQKLHADGYRIADGPCYHYAMLDDRAVVGMHFTMVDTLAERYAAPADAEAGR